MIWDLPHISLGSVPMYWAFSSSILARVMVSKSIAAFKCWSQRAEMALKLPDVSVLDFEALMIAFWPSCSVFGF